jgi:glycosyltransferase involved in cell wall biosynthesis
LAGGLSPGERREPSALVFAEEPEAERQGYRLWGVEGVEVRPACPQGDYWRQAAACGLALHLDYRRTIGRFSAECAALGVPCISTAGATMQRACFPDLIVEPWDVEGAAALAERVLADPAFRAGVVARAARAVEAFDLAPMAARFREALAAVAR